MKRLGAIQSLGDLTGGRCLDVGCATGEYTKELSVGFGRVDAIDVEQNRLEVFRSEGVPRNVTLAEMSVYAMDFWDETFDTVTMIEVLEHLQQPSAALTEIARVLRPEGQLFITTPNRLWPFEQHGLQVRGKKRSGYLFPGLVWASPLHRRVSDSAAFRVKEIRELGTNAGLTLTGATYMMPPLDNRGSARLHRLFDRAERTPMKHFAQTLVARLVKP
ncbi:MAG: class I SAM-dependent methyltransferase [Actinobacteria bacterium]|nr:class I SAM-dependent methyltransferase [Actinomycetota bacterium]MCB9388337.1 class I SAM-dependent methyltransferase [Acidimicrobiia bacterium]